MAETHSVNPQNGFCSKTKTFQSLRPPVPLPPPSHPLSIYHYTLSLLNTTPTTTFSPETTAFLIDSATGLRLTYTDFLRQSQSLSSSLRSTFPSLSKNQVALILSPTSIHVPLLYFSLLSLGVTVSPANPLSTDHELTHLFQLSKPVIAFATSSTVHKLSSLNIPIIIIDSPQFLSMLETNSHTNFKKIEVKQSDVAAILYSSGTTGRIKGVELTHRNLISIIAGMFHIKFEKDDYTPPTNPVALFPLPLFHVFGFFLLIRAMSIGETLVLMERFDFENMLKAVEEYKVTYMPVSPPLLVAMVKSDLVKKYDLSTLVLIGCGGAPLGKEVAKSFAKRFPHVDIVQGYGMTETGGGMSGMTRPEECERHGSAGRLTANIEAKIVDPETGDALPPMKRGELWLRGPMIMKGYIGDKEATDSTLDSEGWLKTGDLCYFDSDGFLYIVDRLKELIKYKAYQVPPAELEHLLQSIPDVADAAVIPYPDEEAGQIPMAYIVRRPGSNINEAQVMDIIAKQVSPYKKIRRVAFINSIPKSPAGKILRRELVNHAHAGASSKL